MRRSLRASVMLMAVGESADFLLDFFAAFFAFDFCASVNFGFFLCFASANARFFLCRF